MGEPGVRTTGIQSAKRTSSRLERRTRLSLGRAERATSRLGEWPLAIGLGLTGAAALFVVSSTMPKERTPRGDDLIYERIASQPFGAHTFPFGYRFGLPAAVHALPLAHSTGFLLLALVCAAGAASFAYLLMRALGARRQIAACLCLLLTISPPFLVVVLRGGRNADIATVLVMMAATYFVVRRKYLALTATLLLGVTVRESALFIPPLAYALWAKGPIDRSAACRVVATATPAAAAYVAIRLGIRTLGEAQVPGYGGSLIGDRLTVMKLGLQNPGQQARRIFSVFGPLWGLVPLAMQDPIARRGAVLLVLCIASMTFAVDWGRMALLAAPVVYPVAGRVLERHSRLRAPVLIGFLVLTIGYAVYMADGGVRKGIIQSPAPSYPVQ